MKKKTINSVLLVLCLFIYAAIFFKTFKSNKSIKTSTVVNEVASKPLKLQGSKIDKFQLNLPSRDPFLDKLYPRQKTKQISKVKKITSAKTVSQQPSIWPKITYYGFVKNKNHKQRLVVFKINNKLYKEREKAKINGILIDKAYGDSIILIYNNERKIYSKK